MTSARLPRWALASAVIGALGALVVAVFGHVQGRVELGDSPWMVPQQPGESALQAADADWAKPGAWVSSPKQEVRVDSPRLRPKVIGVVAQGAQRLALFQLPSGQRVRLAEGDVVPEEGNVQRVDATSVQWLDREGAAQTSRLLDAQPAPSNQ